MSEDDKDDAANDPQNPFAGTPMEQIFGAFAGGQLDMTQIMGQMQKMFAPHEGSVNFDLAKDVARHTAAAAGPDPTPNAAQQGAVDDAVRLAESWLDTATTIPAGATTSAAWSRAEWIEATSGTWQTLVEPIAEHVVKAMARRIARGSQGDGWSADGHAQSGGRSDVRPAGRPGARRSRR